MTATVVTGVLAALLALGIIGVGVGYLVRPQAMSAGFGLPVRPAPDATAWLRLKGIRDVVSGVAVLVPLALGQFHVLGWLLLAAAVTPIGDAAVVLRNGGDRRTAFAVHGATAVAVVAVGVAILLLA